ncbi:anoctamin-5-like [Belonocnema kinseyi]|uniref:anoctamin-5-like n=1 Tax=Belonocnema kinseyi TaxID=2817044 RepID=UPI00143CFA85|nr:anoctamin-5-like [Belonocnema kinseyi]
MDQSLSGQLIQENGNDSAMDLTAKMISLEQIQIPLPVEPSQSDNGEKVEKVDFVLAYVDNNNHNHARKREEFESRLLDQGLELEYEATRQLGFVKINAPKEVLCRYAEIMKLRMPIKHSSSEELSDDTGDFFDDARTWFAKFFKFAQLDPNKFPPKKYQLAAEFSRDKDYLFDIENENFFSMHNRIMIVAFILERQMEGIQRLLAENVYSAAYPLHDGTYKQQGTVRALLYKEWAALRKWINIQPLDLVQEYFGTNFAMYFAWLGFYTYMLIPASIAGLLCFFYGVFSLTSNQLAREACDPSAENVIMCPQCDKTCDYWRLSETCLVSKITSLFDNPATLAFAIFMSFWSVLYLELWKRKSAELSYRWGLVGFDRSAEHPRPKYLKALANIKFFKVKEKVNLITREKEPHVSFWKVRVPATFFSFSIVFLLAAVAAAAVFGVVLYRMSMITSTRIFGRDFDSTSYKLFALPAIAAALNLVCILILNYFYDWLAVYLTEMELLRTQAEFDDSLTLKVYLFQFVNYYASIFYLVFLKGKFVGYPKKYNRIFGKRQEECSPGGCLMELCIQLTIIMVGKQALSTAMEMIFPVLFKWWALFRIHTGLKQRDPIAPRRQWIRDLKLLVWSPRGLYDEYLEMVIQFGFITVFVVAFPLAPFFALANNVLEMRLDATKFLRHYRRPVPRRVTDIGIWARILDALARISVMTNAFIIAFSSNLIPRLVYMTVVSKEKTDVGFLNHSLAYFNTVDFENGTAPIETAFENVTICRYPEYRNPPDDPLPYKRPTIYWHILAARLAFIVVFQNVAGLVTMVVQWCLSEKPRKLRERIKREAFLTEELVIKREAERARERLQYSSSVNRNYSDHLRRRSVSESQGGSQL